MLAGASTSGVTTLGSSATGAASLGAANFTSSTTGEDLRPSISILSDSALGASD